MHDKLEFLGDLTAALVAAGLGGAAANRLRLNPVIGYLVAGIVIGPFTPGYVARSGTIEALAELGLIFLLFSLGLGFSPREFRAVGTLAFTGNFALMGAFAGIAWTVAAFARLPHPVTLGATVGLSSTAIGAALLRQWRIEREPAGQLAIALLVVQDLAAVTLLVFVSTPAGSLTLAGIAAPVLRALAFVAVALVLGATLLHRLVLRLLERAPAEALFGAFAALALVAAWLGYLAGLSFEFGAFIAGAVVSEAAGSRMVQSIVAPFRAIFVSLFFVSMGMLFDPRVIAAQPLRLLALGGALVAARFAGWTVLARLAGIDGSTALLVGAAMVPLGEFNVVLANAARAASRLDTAEYDLLLGVTFLSIGLATVAGPAAKALVRRGERGPQGAPAFVREVARMRDCAPPARVDVIGVPMDLGADRRGVDMGPSAIRYARLREGLEALGVATLVDHGNLAVPVPESRAAQAVRNAKYLPIILAVCDELARIVEEAIDAGGFPVVLGGDHSIAIGTLAGAARARKRASGLIWVDAHGDINSPLTSPSGNVHGMPVSIALEERSVDPTRTVLVAVRELDAGERRRIRELGVRVFSMTEIDRLGMVRVMEESIALAGTGPGSVHLSFDMDGIDPREAPGVGTPVRGGLTYREAHLAMEMLAEARVLGSLEVTEINPILDERNRTAELAVELILSALGKSIL